MRKSLPISDPLRAAGLVFRADFSSQQAWAQQGGSVTGNPTFSDDGVVLDSNDDVYIDDVFPNILGDVVNRGVTFVLELTPTFKSDDGVLRFFFDFLEMTSGAQSPFIILATDSLDFAIDDTTIFTVSRATWAAAWNEEDRNTIVISAKSGNTSMWINGTLIVDADGTTFGKVQTETIAIGGDIATHSDIAPGTYHKFEIWSWACNDVDEPYLRNGTLVPMLHVQNSIVTLPLEIDYDDGSSTQVTDILGQLGGTAFMGTDGKTAAEFPTKDPTKKRGYDFDGGDRITISDNDLLTSDALSVAVVCSLTSGATAGILAKGASTTTGEFWLSAVSSGGNLRIYFGIVDNANGTYRARWGLATEKLQNLSSIIATYDGSGAYAGINIYLDEVQIAANTETNGPFSSKQNTSYDLLLGVGAHNYVTGKIMRFRHYAIELSPMQARALHSIMMSEVIR